jgi:hypothetical protein
VLNIIYTDINQQSTDQQRNMPAQYYSSLKSFITFFYKTNEEIGKNKDKICLRKKLVDAVKYLLPHTPATEACMRLEDVYRFDGRKSGCLRDIGRDLKRSPPLSKYFEKYPQE